MPSIEWHYQWFDNLNRDDDLTPEGCPLIPMSESGSEKDYVDGAYLRQMGQNYGPAVFVAHKLGPGILWANGGSWGIWVMVINPDKEE